MESKKTDRAIIDTNLWISFLIVEAIQNLYDSGKGVHHTFFESFRFFAFAQVLGTSLNISIHRSGLDSALNPYFSYKAWASRVARTNRLSP